MPVAWAWAGAVHGRQRRIRRRDGERRHARGTGRKLHIPTGRTAGEHEREQKQSHGDNRFLATVTAERISALASCARCTTHARGITFTLPDK